VGEGDRVAVRATWTGTHKGVFPLMPFPVSNRKVTFTGMVFWRIANAKVVERWATLDRLGLQQQLAAK
jgi:predicted ester cyclase